MKNIFLSIIIQESIRLWTLFTRLCNMICNLISITVCNNMQTMKTKKYMKAKHDVFTIFTKLFKGTLMQIWKSPYMFVLK